MTADDGVAWQDKWRIAITALELRNAEIERLKEELAQVTAQLQSKTMVIQAMKLSEKQIDELWGLFLDLAEGIYYVDNSSEGYECVICRGKSVNGERPFEHEDDCPIAKYLDIFRDQMMNKYDVKELRAAAMYLRDLANRLPETAVVVAEGWPEALEQDIKNLNRIADGLEAIDKAMSD